MANSNVSNRVSLARASTKAATNIASSKTPAIVHAVLPSILLLVETAFNRIGAFDIASSGVDCCFPSTFSWPGCSSGILDCSDLGTTDCSDLSTSNAGSKV